MNRRTMVKLCLYLFDTALLLFVLSCGGGGTTSPSEVPSGPEIFTRGREDLQLFAEKWWIEQEACLDGGTALSRFPIDVVAGGFDCGGVFAAGCMRFSRIEVGEPWLEAALTHEYIHLILWKQGKDYSHGQPGFLKCDWRNLGRSAAWCPVHDARVWRLE